MERQESGLASGGASLGLIWGAVSGIVRFIVKILSLLFAVLVSGVVMALAQQVDDSSRQQVEEVIEEFNEKKYDSVLAKIATIKAEGETAAFLANLEGAAYTKTKDYASARKAFEKALQYAPGLFAAHFNLGEIEFLQGNYEAALQQFRTMLNADPRNELLQFKVFLCYLMMGDEENAKKALSRVRYPGDTPAWYYAQAAWEYKKGNKGKMSDYLSGARYIYEGKTDLFDETFTDLGFPKR